MNVVTPVDACPKYLERLNMEQRAAVLHGNDPLLIIAGAGTGKTNTLVHRLAHLVVGGTDPRRILLMTFSRRAAAEMVHRVGVIAADVLGPKAPLLANGLVWAGTFHAIGARLLREHAPRIGLDPNFTIHDRGDSADLMNLVRHQLGFSSTERRFPAKATCLAIYSRVVNARAELTDVLDRHFPWTAGWEAELKQLFGGYVGAKQQSGVLDFDDLLLYWAAMMADQAIAREVGTMFDHVLIDEYQDTNRIQAEILAGLKPNGRGVTVVGDDAQSIYSFRAAEVRNILDFPAQFVPPATTVSLTRNYRSSPEILAGANAVIAEAEEGFAKELWSGQSPGLKPALVTVKDENAQVDYVCREILAARETGTALREQAVLFRTSHHSGPLEVELTRRDIPFVKFGGLKFLEAAHVKDVLSTLQFIQNPRDRVAGFRTLQLIPGVGPATAERVLDVVATKRSDLADDVSAAAADGVAAFAVLLGQLHKPEWPTDLEAVCNWYDPHLERRHEDAAARRADLTQLRQIASGYPDRERFLTDITLDPPAASSDIAGPPHRDDDYLILSTIHSAKGREWRQVHILNCVDGCIPSELSTETRGEIEEERRLLYVAMTRAKQALHLIQPQRFYVHNQVKRGDRHVYALPSRFLTPAVTATCEDRVWPEVADTPETTHNGMAKVDIAAQMRDMWS